MLLALNSRIVWKKINLYGIAVACLFYINSYLHATLTQIPDLPGQSPDNYIGLMDNDLSELLTERQNMQTNQVEEKKRLGIILLPSTEVMQQANDLTQQILEQFDVDPELYKQVGANIPHISLYHADFNLQQINQLEQQLQEFTTICPSLSFNEQLGLFESEFVFWNIKTNTVLQCLHENVIESFSHFALPVELEHNSFDHLTPMQLKRLKKYGSQYIFEDYPPHITLLYPFAEIVEDLPKKINFVQAPEIQIKPVAIAIAELGNSGQVRNILIRQSICDK